jgi:benzoyl-CoA 2,3-dioxygenase component A
VIGPYGQSFLMPNHAGANLLMVCTGTGSAPMRAMTERRRRASRSARRVADAVLRRARRGGAAVLRPLMKLPRDFIDINFAFSRVPGGPSATCRTASASAAPTSSRL